MMMRSSVLPSEIDDDQDLFRLYDDEDRPHYEQQQQQRDLGTRRHHLSRPSSNDRMHQGDQDNHDDERLRDDQHSEHEREDDQEHEQMMPPSDAMFDEFREDVETWMEVDNSIRNLQVMLRDRKAFKSRLTEKITAFMHKYDLSNLDMGSAGMIRSRRSHVKTPVSQRTIRDGIEAYFTNINNVTMGMQLLDTVFNSRERVERVSLRRCLPPPPGTHRLR